jgi:hypothetical protein
VFLEMCRLSLAPLAWTGFQWFSPAARDKATFEASHASMELGD